MIIRLSENDALILLVISMSVQLFGLGNSSQETMT